VLGLNRLPKALKDWKIEKITPSSIHRRIVNGKTFKVEYQAACFTRPRFGEALAFNLSPFVYFQGMKRWQFSPVGAVGMASLWFFFRKGSEIPLFAIPFFGTVSDPLYPSAGDGCTSNQGLTAGKTWTDCRNGTGGTLVANYVANTWNDGNYGYGCGLHKDGNGRWVLYRDHCPIDTSSLGSTAVISSAVLTLVPDSHSVATSPSGGAAVICESTVSSTTALTGSDFNNVGFVAWSDSKTYASMSNGTAFDYTFNATGIAGINKTGYSHFSHLCEYDRSNSEPSINGAYWVNIRSSEYTGTDYDPYLSVTYTSVTTPTVTPQNNLAMLGVS
jgi:hypothetical protein